MIIGKTVLMLLPNTCSRANFLVDFHVFGVVMRCSSYICSSSVKVDAATSLRAPSPLRASVRRPAGPRNPAVIFCSC